MGKNIVILCDGTGQIGGVGASTNVYKLFNMLEDRTNRQVVFYDAGIGTGRDGIPAQVFGLGFKKNVIDCYTFLFEQFQAGDHIYLFGFSRGAATVRSLASFIELFGILPASRKDLIKKAIRIYKKRTNHESHAHKSHKDATKVLNSREEAAAEFVHQHHTMWTRVKFIGVWDTVAALGGSGKIFRMITDRLFPHTFHNYSLGPGVDFARHAVSIDDERKTFHPLIWNPDPDPERLKQVWFCGVHTDVGGGYNEEELSYYSLDWMINEAEAKGLLFYKDSDAWGHYMDLKEKHKTKPDELINGKMHNQQTGLIGRLYKREKRSWDPEKYGTIRIHSSVWSRKKNRANGDDPDYPKDGSWIWKFKNNHDPEP